MVAPGGSLGLVADRFWSPILLSERFVQFRLFQFLTPQCLLGNPFQGFAFGYGFACYLLGFGLLFWRLAFCCWCFVVGEFQDGGGEVFRLF